MNRIFDRICLLLAAAGYSEREMHEFVNVLMQMGPGAFARHVANARHMLSDMHLEQLEAASERVFIGHTATGTLSKVERLLLDEANLPKMVAIELLTKELRRRYPNTSFPSESRKGFAAWIERLSAIIPDSELLHVATQIRNNYVHQAPSDWRLK